MPIYLYTFVEFFGYIGDGTPEDPGTDFGLSVLIEATDKQAALLWGNDLLDDYRNARSRFVPIEETPGPSGCRPRLNARRLEGWIEEDESALERSRGCGYPECRVGEIPIWIEPWRHHNGHKEQPDGPRQG